MLNYLITYDVLGMLFIARYSSAEVCLKIAASDNWSILRYLARSIELSDLDYAAGSDMSTKPEIDVDKCLAAFSSAHLIIG